MLLNIKMDSNLILNAPIENQAIRKADVPLIEMNSVPQVIYNNITFDNFY